MIISESGSTSTTSQGNRARFGRRLSDGPSVRLFERIRSPDFPKSSCRSVAGGCVSSRVPTESAEPADGENPVRRVQIRAFIAGQVMNVNGIRANRPDGFGALANFYFLLAISKDYAFNRQSRGLSNLQLCFIWIVPCPVRRIQDRNVPWDSLPPNPQETAPRAFSPSSRRLHQATPARSRRCRA